MTHLSRFLLPILLLAVIPACGKVSSTNLTIDQTPESAPYWPTEGWRVSTPESQGFDSAQLAALLDFIEESDMNVHSLLLIRNGHMVLDAYFYPFTPGSVHDVASVSKSVTSALIGIAVDRGYIKSVDEPVFSFFPENPLPDKDTGKNKMTIEHLVTMTSGFDCGFLPGEQELYAMLQTENYVQSVLDLPMAAAPGSKWSYCSGNMHLLSAIITKTVGLSALEFAREHLFSPLGIREAYWPSDPRGITHGWGDLDLHPQDMAKLGYLYLNGGVWDGQQVISSRWIGETTRSHVSLAENEGYGYGWWLQSIGPTDHLYYASGRGGQKIYVWPAKEIIVVLTGGGYDMGRIQEPLIASIRSDGVLPDNPAANQALQDAVTAITLPPNPKPVPPMPGIATRISGKQYLLERNMLGLRMISLGFHGGTEAMVQISRSIGPSERSEEFRLPVGLDDVYAISSGGPLGLPMGAKGYWKGGDKFVLLLDFIANINRFTITLSFGEDEEDTVSIALSEETGIPGEVFSGSVKE